MILMANKQRTADLLAGNDSTKNGLKRKKPQTVQKQFKKATPAQLKDFQEVICRVIDPSQDPDPDDALYSVIDSSDQDILYDSQTVAGDCVVGDGVESKRTDDQLDHLKRLVVDQAAELMASTANVLMISLIISSVL